MDIIHLKINLPHFLSHLDTFINENSKQKCFDYVF